MSAEEEPTLDPFAATKVISKPDGGEAEEGQEGGGEPHAADTLAEDQDDPQNENENDDEDEEGDAEGEVDDDDDGQPKKKKGGKKSNESKEEKEVASTETILANDVKNIILQVLSPYFDDESDLQDGNAAAAGAAAAAAATTASPTTPGVPPVGSSPTTNNNNNNSTLVPDDAEDSSPRYDHLLSKKWIVLICDAILERLVLMRQPFKFIVHCMIMRKCGEGMHVCSSCYYGQRDGWLGHVHDLSPHLYAVVTVFWCSI